MDILKIKSEYETKKEQISKEIEYFIESATNYDELMEMYEEKSRIYYGALEFNNAEEHRYFDNLQNIAWMIRQVLILCAIYGGMNDEKRKSQTAQKALDTLMALIGNVKKVSNKVIEQENRVIEEADLVLDLVEQFRYDV